MFLKQYSQHTFRSLHMKPRGYNKRNTTLRFVLSDYVVTSMYIVQVLWLAKY